MIKADYIIVGSGLTGATIARTLVDAGRDVVVLERRNAFGGNVRDTVHPCGVRYNLHGPHYFRTNSERIWEWVQRFGRFSPFAACVQTCIEGRLYRWPLRMENLDLLQQAIEGYNEKMWGGIPSLEVTARIDVHRTDSYPRLKLDKYQGVPTDGYSAWMEKMLLGVYCISGFDFLKRSDEVQYGTLIYTGPIDELYDLQDGRLQYRSMKRDHIIYRESRQATVQVNCPEPENEFIRSIEWNHLPWNSQCERTLVTYETPYSPTNPDAYEYPHYGVNQSALLQSYLDRAKADGIIAAGRLALHRYYDMDQAIAAGLKIAEKLLCG